MKLSDIGQYYHTIKHLRLVQIVGKVIFRIKKRKPNMSAPPKPRKVPAHWTAPILKPLTFSTPQTLNLLNQERDISTKNIWCDPEIDKLWLYNLHYFDVVNSLKGLEQSVWCKALMHRWIKENPPATGYGWDSYPISLRIVNWIKWILAGNQPSAELLHSLAIQTRYLIKRLEIHLLGNHILANAKALLFSGLFFAGKEANHWFKKGFRLFEKEVSAQIMTDGGHFELSPMYHSIVLEDILDVINLFKTYQQDIMPQTMTVCKKMFYWLDTMCHMDGDIAFFNDAALGIAPTREDIRQYQVRLKLDQNYPDRKALTYFSDSGYCRIQRDNILLLADVGNVGASYQPGHAHADTLSFEISKGPQRLLINSGISTYANSTERLQQRGSKAHNTLVVNDENSSQVWKSFRVGKRADVKDVEIDESADKMILTACHDGYFKSYKIIHRRTWTVENKTILIEDKVFGSGGTHKIELFFHVYPGIKLQQQSDQKILFYTHSNEWVSSLEGSGKLMILDSTYHPRFNISIPNKKIVANFYQDLPLHLNTYIKFN